MCMLMLKVSNLMLQQQVSLLQMTNVHLQVENSSFLEEILL